jgi:NAD(P) transhydrogenase subunit alpha
MMIAALKETQHETRVALTPNAVKQYLKLGLTVAIEKDAGLGSGYSDEDYIQAGAAILKKNEIASQSHIILSVNPPTTKDLKSMQKGSLLITQIDNDKDNELIQFCLTNELNLFSMNLIPRISRAQNMDSLSSQANLAGYRAVIEAASHFKKIFPMMMTAAGMIHPAKVLILGAGVAGLQAIATAKRMGAVVYAFDVRRAAKEQVESLGAEFIEVAMEQDAETKGGYASETSEEYKAMQAKLIDEYAKMSDIVISTALIPGRKAPILIHKTTVDAMKPGSVIVDLATAKGGNCEVSVCDEIIQYQGITVIGLSNLAGLVPETASDLYANNLMHLIRLLVTNPEDLTFNQSDEIIQQALLCHQGQYLPFQPVKEANHA